MCFGKGSNGYHSLDRYSATAGLSAAGFTAIIPGFYRSVASVLQVHGREPPCLSPQHFAGVSLVCHGNIWFLIR